MVLNRLVIIDELQQMPDHVLQARICRYRQVITDLWRQGKFIQQQSELSRIAFTSSRAYTRKERMREIVGFEKRRRTGKRSTLLRIEVDRAAFNGAFRKGGVLLAGRDPADMFCRYHRAPLLRLNYQQPCLNAPELAGMMTVPRSTIAAGMTEYLSAEHRI